MIPFLNRLLCCLTAATLVSSCGPEEQIINSFDDSWRLLVAGDTPSLALIKMPLGTLVHADVYASANGTAAPIVSATRRYRNDIFILHRESPSITVLSADSLRFKASIDLGSAGIASDIAFVNSTTAFAVHPQTNLLTIIDLTLYTVADTLRISGRPIAVSAIGNMVGVIAQEASTLSILDSRTFTVVSTIALPQAPTFVDADPVNNAFVAVCLGAGKIDADPVSMPQMAFVSLDTRTLVAEVEISARAGQGAEKVVSGLAMSEQGYAFVSVEDAVLRVNVRSRTRAAAVLFEPVSGIAAVPSRRQIMVIRSDARTIDVYDDLVESRKATVTAPFDVQLLLALTP